MKWNKSLVLILALCLSIGSNGQDKTKKSDKPVTITGKVLTVDNMPVSGAVLCIDNIRTSITTKEDGSYKIKVNPTADSLEVRSSQYGKSVVAINGHTLINFLLGSDKEKAAKLNDTTKVAPVAENTKKQKKTARKMNTYNNIYEMIRGEVSGVVVSGRNIQIQQAHSFFGSSTPLFVVNGVIVPSIDNINPVEVKSIGLLKGTAGAIYGENGSNGVISITLKNGDEQ